MRSVWACAVGVVVNLSKTRTQSRAAQYCSQHLLANLTSTNKFGQDMEAALKEAFHSTENKVSALINKSLVRLTELIW